MAVTTVCPFGPTALEPKLPKPWFTGVENGCWCPMPAVRSLPGAVTTGRDDQVAGRPGRSAVCRVAGAETRQRVRRDRDLIRVGAVDCDRRFLLAAGALAHIAAMHENGPARVTSVARDVQAMVAGRLTRARSTAVRRASLRSPSRVVVALAASAAGKHRPPDDQTQDQQRAQRFQQNQPHAPIIPAFAPHTGPAAVCPVGRLCGDAARAQRAASHAERTRGCGRCTARRGR